MLIRTEDVQPLNDWSPAQFTNWFLKGLRSEKMGVPYSERWEPLHDLILYHWPIVDQLAKIYELLDEQAQRRMTLGLGSVIRISLYYSDNRGLYSIVAGLVGYACIVNASSYLVEYLEDPRFLFGRDDLEADDVFAHTFNIIAGMSPAGDTEHLLQRLSNSRLYRDEYDLMLQDALSRT